MNQKIKDITIIALFACILFVQEQILSFIPNVQITMLLIMVYTRVFKVTKTTIIVIIHVILDNLLNGSFNIVILPAMFIGWELVVIVCGFIFKNTNNTIILALIAFTLSFIYSFMFLITSKIFLNVDVITYIANDLIFTLIFALSSFISVLWLFIPLCNVLNNKINNSYS